MSVQIFFYLNYFSIDSERNWLRFDIYRIHKEIYSSRIFFKLMLHLISRINSGSLNISALLFSLKKKKREREFNRS